MSEVWNIKTDFQLKTFFTYAENLFKQKGRINATADANEKRSSQQNKLIYDLYNNVAAKVGDRTSLDVRCESKLYCGVPLLMTENESSRTKWNALIKDRFTMEEKQELMEWFPVTSLMNTAQLSQYVDRMCRYWAKNGVYLEV